jgi:hypothetical protein
MRSYFWKRFDFAPGKAAEREKQKKTLEQNETKKHTEGTEGSRPV